MDKGSPIIVPREILLIEIDRHCVYADCNARILIGLTKQEAFTYRGFECVHCNRWNDDSLNRNDVPEWWEELQVPSWIQR